MSESRVNDNYKYCRSHFKKRLLERYEISINDEEYDYLVFKKPGYIHLYKLNATSSVCCLTIHEKQVYCIYSRKSFLDSRRLKTVLRADFCFPPPKKLAIKGMTPEIFQNEINEFIKQVHEYSRIYTELGQKSFYCSLDISHKMKKAVNDYVNKGTFPIDIAVKSIIEKCIPTTQY